MIEALLVALVLIAILCVAATVIMKLVPNMPAPLPTVIWGIVTIVCLLLLLLAVTGELDVNFSGDL